MDFHQENVEEKRQPRTKVQRRRRKNLKARTNPDGTPKRCTQRGCQSVASSALAGRPYCEVHLVKARLAVKAAENLKIVETRGESLPPLLPLSELPTELQTPPVRKGREKEETYNLRCQAHSLAGAEHFRKIIHGEVPLPNGWPWNERLGRSYIAYAEWFFLTPGIDKKRQYIISDCYRKFFITAFSTRTDNDAELLHSMSVLCVAKKNKKSSTLAAIIASCLIIAPWPDMNLMTGSPTKRGNTLFDGTKTFIMQLRGMTKHHKGIKVNDAPFLITSTGDLIITRSPSFFGPENAGQFICVGDTTTQQLSAAPRGIVCLDELGRMKDDRMFTDMQNSTRAAELTPLILISIRGDEDSPMVMLLDRLKKTKTPFYFQDYSAEGIVNPYSDEAILAANPTIGEPGGPKLSYLQNDAKEAQLMPHRRASYFRETLNVAANVYTQDHLLNEAAWSSGFGKPELKGPLYAGLDIGHTRDASALAFYDPKTGGLVSHIFLPGEPSLDLRSQEDGNPYTEWLSTGRVHLTQDSMVIDLMQVLNLLIEYDKRYSVAELFLDPFHQVFFEQCMRDSKRYDPSLHLPPHTPVKMAAGNKNGEQIGISPFIDRFRFLANEGTLRHGNCPILRHAIAVSELRSNNQNQKSVNKSKGNAACNDALMASILAVGGRFAFDLADTPLPTPLSASMIALEQDITEQKDEVGLTSEDNPAIDGDDYNASESAENWADLVEEAYSQAEQEADNW